MIGLNMGLLFSGVRATGTAAIEYVSVNTLNGSSAAIPSGASGDLVLCAAIRFASNTIPSIPDITPDEWQTPAGANITATHSDTGGGRIVFDFIETAGESGTFANAQRIINSRYRNASGIIAAAWASGTGTTVSVPALTLSQSGWVGIALGHSVTEQATPPAWGATRANSNGRSYFDSDGPLGSFGGLSISLTTSQTWVVCAFAIA